MGATESSLGEAADRAWVRLGMLGEISDEVGALTRVFGSPGMARAVGVVEGWMKEAGLVVERDGWGNIFGRTLKRRGRPLLVMGSHLDTVRHAGKFDGALGVLVGLAALEAVGGQAWEAWPFDVEVAGFSDEEGARFQTTYLGSRSALGRIGPGDLARTDREGVALSELVPTGEHNPVARYRLGELMGYLEVHIEQGPVLESEGLALGVVVAIAGQTRAEVRFVGRAAHAGTCPMELRRDALAAAAEWVLGVEREGRATPGLVATVGCLEVEHAASNVVPGKVRATLDVRHSDDAVRVRVVKRLLSLAGEIAERRGGTVTGEVVQENGAVACSPELREVLGQAVRAVQGRLVELVSGAGHDAVPMAGVAPMGMVFVRCAGGISHHPEETVWREDVGQAVAAVVGALGRLGLEKKAW